MYLIKRSLLIRCFLLPLELVHSVHWWNECKSSKKEEMVMFIIYIWQSQSTRFRSMNVGKEEGGHFSGFSGLPFCGKKLLLADLGAEGASSIRREGGQATYATGKTGMIRNHFYWKFLKKDRCEKFSQRIMIVERWRRSSDVCCQEDRDDQHPFLSSTIHG